MPLALPFRMLGALVRTLLRRMRRGPRRPGWSLPFETGVELLRATMRSTAGRPPLEQRAAWHGMPSSRPPRGKTRTSAISLAGMPGMRVEPVVAPVSDANAGATGPVILYIHGGSFMWGQYAQYAETLAHLALATGAPVLWLEYPLLPEHPYPAAREAVRRAFEHVRRTSPGAAVFLAGDSSGANLALAAAVDTSADPVHGPSGCILISAWVDLSATGGSLVENQGIDWGLASDIEGWARTYAAGADLGLPGLSPGRADPRGLCPTLVLYGEHEILRDQNQAWVERARAAGVAVTARMFPEMVHGWIMLPAFTAQAGLAFEEIARFVRAPASWRTGP